MATAINLRFSRIGSNRQPQKALKAYWSGRSSAYDLPSVADVGPGVYVIHSPRVREKEEITDLLRKALEAIPLERLWVNPGCGLKSHRCQEVVPALKNIVAAVLEIRSLHPKEDAK